MKQVIVVNEELRLPSGKFAVQVARESVAAFLREATEHQSEWLHVGMPKIVVTCQQ